jgi:Tfp pilus assembly PilM family ATPase
MRKKNAVTSVFITDSNIGIYTHNKKDKNKSLFANEVIPDGIIEFGYVKKPFKLMNHIKRAIRKLNFKPNHIHWILPDQNVLIRELTVTKEALQNTDILTYLENQVNVTLFFPFGEATFAYKIKSESEFELTLSVFISDKNLVDDYLDIFDKVGIKKTNFNIISSVISTLYNDKSSDSLENSMVVAVYDNNITINIIENKFTIFGMNDECDLSTKTACVRIEEYIERIANYYQFNLRKGKQKIDNVFVIDMTDNKSRSDRLKRFKEENLITNNLVFLNAEEFNSRLIGAQSTIDITYISSITVNKEGFSDLNFNISRPNKTTIYMNYIMLFSISLIALLALIYIPYINTNDQIIEQETLNNALIIQRDMLEDSIQGNNSFSSYEQAYNEIFTYLDLQSVKETVYIEDLIAFVDSDMHLSNFKFYAQEKRIEFAITANTEVQLYEYVLAIYEEYGIIDGIDNVNAWIVSYPESTFTSNLTMKVVVYYA